MNHKSGYALVLMLSLLFLVSNACGITSNFGGTSGGSSSSISETLSTDPKGGFSSTSSLNYGSSVTLQQNTQVNGLDYQGEESVYSNYNDYVKVTYNLKNAVLGISLSNTAGASNMGSYAIASEEWDVVSADSITFSAFARNRKNYEAKVTTDITKGGVVFTNEAKASSTEAIATQTLNQAWGDKITRTLSAKNNRKRSAHYSTDSFYYTGSPKKYDYKDTAKATYGDAVLTPTGGPGATSPPGFDWPAPPKPPSYPFYQPTVWPTGSGW